MNDKFNERFLHLSLSPNDEGIFYGQLVRYKDLIENGFRCRFPDITEEDKYDVDKFEEWIKNR